MCITGFVKYMSTEEWNKIKDYIETISSPSMKMLLKFLMYSGQRLNDVCNMKLDNLSSDYHRVNFIMQKTKKPIEVTLPSILYNDLSEYIKSYQSNMSEGYLFFPDKKGNSKNPHILKSSVGALFTTLRRDLDMESSYYTRIDGHKLHRISPHTLRHYACFKIVEASDVVTACQWFGWSKLDMVLRYSRAVKLANESEKIAEAAFST